MGFSPKTTRTWGGEDYRIFGSRHAINNAKSYLLDAAAFPAGDYPDGIVPIGQTVALKNDKLVPFDPEGADGAEKFLGLTTATRDVSDGDELAPVAWHGLVHSAYLPATSVVPDDGGQITFN